uniref:Replicative DNA helicase n=1 Tax=Triparma laevis TaxID=1534972 RepID=A0A0K2RW14_9STRA|nr:replication helicase subunit [Triparma laevis]BAS19028.1 replication helicase subunit [Triparma laevis]
MENFDSKTSTLLIEKYLPHNFLSEKVILGNLLISNEALDITLRTLSVEAFYFKNHQIIYQTICTLHNTKKLINLTTLTNYLQEQGLLEKIGGVTVLIELINQVPNLVNLEEYLSLIQDKFIRRTLIKLGYQIINSSYVTNISLEQIILDLESELVLIGKKTETNQVLSSAELLSNVIQELKDKSNNITLPGISSGFYDLDALTQGFQKSDLIITAGRPSMGKTAFCLNVATNILKKNKLPILFFSLEMSKEQLMYRLLASETNINSTRLRAGNIKQSEWDILNSTVKRFSRLPLFIDDTPNISIIEMRKKIKKIRFEQQKLGLIIIDYLQLMENSNKNENRVQELSQITRGLKNIAREFNVPVIVLSQLSRNVENRINKRPILSDLRESGSIEQDADLVLMLYRDEYYNVETAEPNITELIISKHRNGPIGTAKIFFEGEYTKFKNLN